MILEKQFGPGEVIFHDNRMSTGDVIFHATYFVAFVVGAICAIYAYSQGMLNGGAFAAMLGLIGGGLITVFIDGGFRIPFAEPDPKTFTYFPPPLKIPNGEMYYSSSVVGCLEHEPNKFAMFLQGLLAEPKNREFTLDNIEEIFKRDLKKRGYVSANLWLWFEVLSTFFAVLGVQSVLAFLLKLIKWGGISEIIARFLSRL